MTNSITPPPELVEQWIEETRSHDCIGAYPADLEQCVATRAAQWGADQELEACCEWVEDYAECGHSLRLARRPKPPSLKDRALQAWAAVEAGTDDQTAMAVIRRALEAMPDD
jgi:hypothetical protein